MATLQEMLEQDLGLGTEKVASVQPIDGMDKLAMELGLFGDMEKEAEAVEHEENEGDGKNMGGKEDEDEGEKKEASMGLDDIYSALFPEDQGVAVVKTAEEQKIASAEEAIGARAYDYFRAQMDNRIEKIAMDMLQGKFAADATTDGDGDAEPNEKVIVPNNRAGKGAIDTTPQHQGDLGATNGPADIGHEKMQVIKAASVEQQALMGEMFTRGQEMAVAIADQMDALASQEKVAAEEINLDEESEKIAAVCGAFIERGQFEKLAELGMERYGDPMAYFYPYVEEKVAESGATTAIKNFGTRIMSAAKKVKGHAAETGENIRKSVTGRMRPEGLEQVAKKGPGAGVGRDLTKAERREAAKKALKGSLPYLGAAAAPAAVYGGYKGVKALSKKDEEQEG